MRGTGGIAALFSGSAQGLWFDPSDIGTMFQDTGGTIPVTTIGQTIALIRDKSGRGNHATQATIAARPTYGRHPSTGVRNLLTHTENFSSAAWTKIAGGTGVVPTVTSGFTDPNVSNTAWRLQCSRSVVATPDYSVMRYAAVSRAGSRSIWVKSNTGASQTFYLGTPTGLLSFTATTTWTRFDAVVASASAYFDIGLYSTAGGTALDILIWHPQYETTSPATAYQKVEAAYDVTEEGVSTVGIAWFDGVDDSLSVISLNLSVGDEVTAVIAQRKASDAARAMLMELSIAATSIYDGCFSIEAPYFAGANYKATSRGTIASSPSATGFTAPHAAVLTLQGKIATDTALLRVNGTQVASSATDQGVGNYETYPFYIGMRAGTSLPYSGAIYNLLVIGQLVPTARLAIIELSLKNKAGIV